MRYQSQVAQLKLLGNNHSRKCRPKAAHKRQAVHEPHSYWRYHRLCVFSTGTLARMHHQRTPALVLTVARSSLSQVHR